MILNSNRSAKTFTRGRLLASPLVAAILMSLVFALHPSTPAFAQGVDWNTRSRTLYAELVAMRTSQGQNQTPRMTQLLADRFHTGGFAAEDVHILPYDDTAALIVRYRGNNASGKRPILLLAHMDVVDALASDWSLEPFMLTEREGYFYGRGTVDSKVGVVALTTAFLRFRAEGFVPGRDLIIAFTGDEETNNNGARALVKEWRNLADCEFALNSDMGGGQFTPDGKLVGFSLQTSEKTYATFTLTIHNRGRRSSQPRADNAVYEMAAALSRIAAYRFAPQINDTTQAYFEAYARKSPAPLANAMRRFIRNPSDRAAADAIEAAPAFIGSTRTTCVATRIAGGHADNALPETAVATINCRIFPGVSIETIQATLARVAANPGIEIALSPDFFPATDPSRLREGVLKAYTNAVRARFPDAPIVPTMDVSASDGAFLRAARIPTYGVDGIWGVTPDDDRLHGRDERLRVEAFYQDMDHWRTMLMELAR